MNLYGYVGGNPIMRTDSSGLYFGIDDAIASGTGAIIGLTIQAGTDLINRQNSGWESYVGAFVGGAAGGEASLYVGPFAGAGIGSLTADLTTQGLQLGTGRRSSYDPIQTLVNTSLGTVTGGVAGRVNSYSLGVTTGILFGLNYGQAGGGNCPPKCH